MAENSNSKCPYCGSGLLQEEDGYRCRFCKSFFPFEVEQSGGLDDSAPLSLLRLREQANEEEAKGGRVEHTDEDKAFARRRMRNELIGMATAFVSLVCMFFSKTLKMPYLMIPGFAFWAFSAGYTVYQIIKAKKVGRKAAYIRIFLLLFVAILVLLFVHAVEPE